MKPSPFGHPGTRANTEEIVSTIAGETETPLARLEREAKEAEERKREALHRISVLRAKEEEKLPHHSGPWHYLQSENDARQYSVGLTPDLGYRSLDPDEYMRVGGVCRLADAKLIADAPTLLDALEEMWRFADNLADGAPDASPSHQRANELAGKYRDLLKKHGRTPWEDR